MAQTSGFDPTTQVKTCFDCNMFDVANWLACLNGKKVQEGRLHIRPFQFHLKEHWGYPQSLDSLLPWTEAISAHLDRWQNPSNVIPKTTVSNSLQMPLGRSLRSKFNKGSVIRSGKKATHKRSRVYVSLAL